MNVNIFQWREEYNIGIESIDQQHSKLIDIMNDIQHLVIKMCRQTSVEEDDCEKTKDLLYKLNSYTLEHFKAEEELFNNSDYPHKEEHLKKHQEFKDMLTYYYDQFYMKSFDPLRALSDISEWFLEHTQGMDRGYVSFCQESIKKGA